MSCYLQAAKCRRDSQREYLLSPHLPEKVTYPALSNTERVGKEISLTPLLAYVPDLAQKWERYIFRYLFLDTR